MTYPQTLDYLYHTLPMFSRLGAAAFTKDLSNTIALCNYLKNPQERFKTIHVGGTNGKGSVSHMLAAILQTAGYKTGLYTSPHLADFRERIKVNGVMASQAFVVDFVKNHQTFIEAVKPSFFEITVAMAFQYFAEQQVDVAVVEVDLGGRLDSTNIITPELAVITNISWDHMNLLGDTLQKIAGEKAGIIKKGLPVIIGEREEETAPVFERVATEKEAPLFFASDRFQVSDFKLQPDVLDVIVQDTQYGHLKKFALDLTGIYQIKNLRTVLQAVEIARQQGFQIPDEAVAHGLRNAKKRTGLHGRWDVVHQSPAIILEVAHNPAGIAQMLSHLQQLAYQHLHLIVGLVKDKDIDSVLQLLPQSATYYFTNAHIPRALDAAALQEKAALYKLNGDVFNDVNAAVQQALKNAAAEDVIVVCGSVFLVAEVDTALLPVQA